MFLMECCQRCIFRKCVRTELRSVWSGDTQFSDWHLLSFPNGESTPSAQNQMQLRISRCFALKESLMWWPYNLIVIILVFKTRLDYRICLFKIWLGAMQCVLLRSIHNSKQQLEMWTWRQHTQAKLQLFLRTNTVTMVHLQQIVASSNSGSVTFTH